MENAEMENVDLTHKVNWWCQQCERFYFYRGDCPHCHAGPIYAIRYRPELMRPDITAIGTLWRMAPERDREE